MTQIQLIINNQLTINNQFNSQKRFLPYQFILIKSQMQSQQIEIVFNNYDRECIKFLKILREIQSNFCKNANASKCQLGFQIEDKFLHIYTAQQSMFQSTSNTAFMLATFNLGFYKIQGYTKPVAFGVRIKGFISKLLICKKEQIDQIKFLITDSKVTFRLCDKNSKGWISYSMDKMNLPIKDFNYQEDVSELIEVAEINESWMEREKKSRTTEDVILAKDKIKLQSCLNQVINSSQKCLKQERDLVSYNKEGIFNFFGKDIDQVKIKMHQSICRHFAFYKNLGFKSTKIKLFAPTNDESRFFLEFQNNFFKICKTFLCEVLTELQKNKNATYQNLAEGEMNRQRNMPLNDRTIFKIEDFGDNNESFFNSMGDRKREPRINYILPEADVTQRNNFSVTYKIERIAQMMGQERRENMAEQLHRKLIIVDQEEDEDERRYLQNIDDDDYFSGAVKSQREDY